MEFEPYKINLDFNLVPKKRKITINGTTHTLSEDDYHVSQNGEIITMCINQEWYKFKEIESYNDNANYWKRTIDFVQKNSSNIGFALNTGISGYRLYESYRDGNDQERKRAVAQFLIGLGARGAIYGVKKAIKHFWGQNKTEYGYQGAASGKVLVKRNSPYQLYDTIETYF